MAYITRQQAAERLAVSLRTLDGIIQRGGLPAYRLGSRLIRLKDSDIDAYMDGRQVAPAPKQTKQQQTRPCLYTPGMKVV